jgi:hypothetical protein
MSKGAFKKPATTSTPAKPKASKTPMKPTASKTPMKQMSKLKKKC